MVYFSKLLLSFGFVIENLFQFLYIPRNNLSKHNVLILVCNFWLRKIKINYNEIILFVRNRK